MFNLCFLSFQALSYFFSSLENRTLNIEHFSLIKNQKITPSYSDKNPHFGKSLWFDFGFGGSSET